MPLNQHASTLSRTRGAAASRVLPRLDGPRALFVICLLTLVWLVVVPLYFVVRASLTPDTLRPSNELTFANYADLFSSGATYSLLVNSLVFAIGGNLIALPAGALLAWIVERTNTPLKILAYLAAYSSLAIPGILQVIGWILLLGPQAGVINVLVRSASGGDGTFFNLFSMAGMILVEGIEFTPAVFLLMLGPFRAMDPSLEESSATSGAKPLSTFFQVTLPLAAPAIVSVLIITAVRTVESFEVPALIGLPGGVEVLTSEIWLTITYGLRPKYGAASAYGVLLIAVVAIGIFYYSQLTRSASKYATITGKGLRPRTTDIGPWCIFTTAFVVLLPILIVLPILALLWVSLQPYNAPPSLEALGRVTLSNYPGVFQNAQIVGALSNSFLVAAVAATLTAGFSAIVAWLVVRTAIRGRGLLDFLASLTIVFPGLVLGIALLRTYVSLPLPVYGTLWILVLAFMSKYMPFGMRFNSPGLLRISRELEESSQTSGVGWLTTFREVVPPLMMPSLAGAWIYIFLLAMKELSVALLLYSPGTRLLATMIFDQYQAGRYTEMAAFGIVVTVILGAVAFVFHRFSSRHSLQTAN
jgi:iron(III) transport system permease protein